MEEWKQILEFPRYSVSDLGRVQNDETGHVLRPALNQLGIPHVGFSRAGVVHRRSVAPLVANSFLRPHHLPAFDTPINLDGDRENNAVINLTWRPRWFSVEYHRQFRRDRIYLDEPVVEVDSGLKFDHTRHAAMSFGLLEMGVVQSVLYRRRVWPTNQWFRLLSDLY